MLDPGFHEDVLPLLTTGVGFDHAVALGVIRDRLLELL
jgi:hypothetical protein